MKADKERMLAAFARVQYGIVPRRQLLDARVTKGQIQYLLRSNRLERLFESVYRVNGVPACWEQRLLGACWAGGQRGLASHCAAVALWDLPGGAPVLEITGPRWRRARHEGVIPHESTRLDPIDVTVVKGSIPVTRPARTFLDFCGLVERGLVDEHVAELQFQEAIRRNLVDIGLVGLRWERLGGTRRLGGRVAERIIDRWLPISARTDSTAELELLTLLRVHGLPDPVPQHRVWLGPDDFVDIDFAWPDVRVGVEFDSYRWHGGRMKHDLDARRHLRLQKFGWHLVRVTDAELDAGCAIALDALDRLLAPAA